MELRKALKLTQKEIAQQLGITQQFVSQIEKGLREPSDQLLKHLCALYNTTMLWLTAGEGDMFIPLEEIIKKQIAQSGERAYYEALRKLLDDNGLVVLGSALATRPGGKGYDQELDNMMSFLVSLWSVGDEKLKSWAQVQFERAFPPDIVEEVQKKIAGEQCLASIS
jgi:transcriptional regulator with XRE-family HTH domain